MVPSPDKGFSASKKMKLCSRLSSSFAKRQSTEGAPLTASFGRHSVLRVEKTQRDIQLELMEDAATSSDQTSRLCILQGSWINTNVAEGDVVNVLVDFNKSRNAYVIDDYHGFLVVRPDLLVSGTSIVSTLFCMRKAVLNEIFKGGEGKLV